MNRSTAWLLPLVSLALSAPAHAAEPGFYFAASASRVEHDIEGSPGTLITVVTPGLSPFPRPAPGVIAPPGNVFSPFPTPFPNVITAISSDVDEVDAGYGATVGYRINRYLAAELGYADFGEYAVTEQYSFGSTRYEIGVRGPSFAVLGSLPLGARWELFLRGGVLFTDQEVTFKVRSSSPSTSGPDRSYSDEVVLAGAGVQWSFAQRWSARLEYQRSGDMKYDDTGESSIEQASLSVLFKL